MPEEGQNLIPHKVWKFADRTERRRLCRYLTQDLSKLELRVATLSAIIRDGVQGVQAEPQQNVESSHPATAAAALGRVVFSAKTVAAENFAPVDGSSAEKCTPTMEKLRLLPAASPATFIIEDTNTNTGAPQNTALFNLSSHLGGLGGADVLDLTPRVLVHAIDVIRLTVMDTQLFLDVRCCKISSTQRPLSPWYANAARLSVCPCTSHRCAGARR